MNQINYEELEETEKKKNEVELTLQLDALGIGIN